MIQTFSLKERKTLVIIGLSLGSWAGGEQYSYFFKTLALTTGLPLVVFSPGNQHQEIIEIIEKCHSEFEQILIGVCPSAIFYLERLGLQNDVKLPLEKISFFVTGEPFPESMRLDLQTRSGMSSDRVSMLSVYGSADTGILGVESFPLIKVRQFLSQNPTVAREVGFTSGVIPNLYHAQTDGNFLEIVDKELVVTKWQGIPLVRYNLEDHVQIFSWSGLCHKISSVDSKNSATWQALEQLELPDVLAVSGRSQGCLFLCGSNIFESMLQEVILQSSFRERFTGNFVVWTSVISGQQQLHWQIEFKRQALLPTEEEVATMQSEFVSLLSIQQPEFGEDYEKFYRPAEVLGLPIFQFHFSTFPYLENHPRFASATKRTVVLDQGPL